MGAETGGAELSEESEFESESEESESEESELSSEEESEELSLEEDVSWTIFTRLLGGEAENVKRQSEVSTDVRTNRFGLPFLRRGRDSLFYNKKITILHQLIQREII